MALFYLLYEKEVLFVVNVHGYFKTKTDVAVLRCFPFHNITLFFLTLKNTVYVTKYNAVYVPLW